MILVYMLTEEQANQLKGVEYTTDMTFNPIQDADSNWIISVEEVSTSTIDWVKELPTIEYNPKVIDFF